MSLFNYSFRKFSNQSEQSALPQVSLRIILQIIIIIKFRNDSPESPLESPTTPTTSCLESPTSPQHCSASTIVPSASEEPPVKQPRRCHSDVGAFVDSYHSLVSDSDKYRPIEEHFIPGPLHKFPRASNGHSFQHSWLSKYHWLQYSQRDDGGYCLPCALFF